MAIDCGDRDGAVNATRPESPSGALQLAGRKAVNAQRQPGSDQDVQNGTPGDAGQHVLVERRRQPGAVNQAEQISPGALSDERTYVCWCQKVRQVRCCFPLRQRELIPIGPLVPPTRRRSHGTAERGGTNSNSHSSDRHVDPQPAVLGGTMTRTTRRGGGVGPADTTFVMRPARSPGTPCP